MYRRAFVCGVSLLIGLSPFGAAPVAAAEEERPLTFEEVRRVERLVGEARELREAGRVGAAISLVEEAIAIHPAPWIHYNLARLYEDAGDDARALHHYEACLAGDAEPKVLSRARVGRDRVRFRSLAHLQVAVVPDGAMVIVDGEPRGRSPLPPLDLPAGRHVVRVEREGCHPQEREVELVAGTAVQELRFTLESLVAPTIEVLGARRRDTAAGHIVVLDDELEPPRTRAGAWRWVTLGTGVALLAGGTTLYLLGEADFQEVREAPGYGGGGPVDMTARRARSLVEGGQDKQTVGAVLMGVGGAAVATSIVLFVLDATVWDHSVARGASPATRFVVSGGPAGALLGWEGAF